MPKLIAGKGKKKDSPKKTPEEKIRDTDIALNNIKKTRKKSPKTEELTETEQILLSKILTAYLAQYPLITKGKKPSRYAHNHRMAASLKKKLVRMKLIESRE